MNGCWVVGSASKTDAIALKSLRAKILAHLNPEIEPTEPPIPTVLEYLEFCLNGPWKEQVAHELMAPGTWELYRGIIGTKIVGNRIADVALDQFEARDYEVWLAGLMTEAATWKNKKTGEVVTYGKPPRPMANASKRRYATMLVTAFGRAHLIDKLIPSNPIKGHPKPKAGNTPTYRVLKLEEFPRMIKLIRGREREIQRVRIEMAVRLGLIGLGPAEACGLRYEDFDGEGIEIQRQVVRYEGKKRIRPLLKTPNRMEFVPVDDPELVKLLTEKENGWVLPVKGGAEPMEPNNLRKLMDETFAGSEFEGFDPYDFRHSYARILLDSHLDIRTCADLMRHSPEVFIKSYVHTDRRSKIEASKRLKRA